MRNRHVVLQAVLLALFCGGLVAQRSAAGEAYRVIVNPSNPATTVSRTDLARLFMRTAGTWPDGTPAAAVDQPRTAPVRDAFSRDVHKRDADRVVAHWATLVYAGREMPPPVRRSDQEVLEFVRQTPGGVGYVSAHAAVDGVKVIAVR
jgi:ABC-type phosphate transport system substrate-binding protein